MPAIERTLVSVNVPLLFNGTELERSRNERVMLSIDRLYREYIRPRRIDVRPPYQRHEAWQVKDERLFMASCFSGFMPLGNLHLCKKNSRANCTNYYALDGRQRITAFDNFFNDKFKVEVVFRYSNGDKRRKKMFWSEMVADDNCTVLRDQLLGSEIPAVLYDWIPLETQRKIFLAVNSGKPLNAEEYLYCNFFLARKLISHVFDEVFGELKTVCQNAVRSQRRFADVKMAHEILLLCGGPDFTKEPEPRSLRTKDREPSARLIHAYLAEHGVGWEDELTHAHMSDLSLSGKLPTLKSLAALLLSIFEENSTLGRLDEKGNVQNHILARNVTDVMGFLYKAIKEQRTNITTLRQNSALLVKGLAAYYKEKPEHYANQSTSDLPVMVKKFALMEKHIKKAF